MKIAGILMAALMLAACSSLPVIQPVSGPPTNRNVSCPSIFVRESTRFIHSIEVQASGRTQAVMIGITLLNPAVRSVSCAIVTPEGLSLFEASSAEGKVSVGRALPPFDAPDFAENMMADIGLIFLTPQGVLDRQGIFNDGRAVCRWHRKEGGWIDVSKSAEGPGRIERYTERGRLERSVTIVSDGDRAYSAIELHASDLISYSLNMSLIESEAVTEETRNY